MSSSDDNAVAPILFAALIFFGVGTFMIKVDTWDAEAKCEEACGSYVMLSCVKNKWAMCANPEGVPVVKPVTKK